MTATALITLIGLQALLAMSPGPAAVLTIKTAASEGARAGLLLSLGLAIAVVIWAAAALAGLSLLFDVAPYLQTSLKLIGAGFLVWVGISLWRGADQPLKDVDAAAGHKPLKLIRLGIWTDLANPKALAYFAAVFTTIMPTELSVGWTLAVLAIIFGIELAWYALLSMVFSRSGPRRAYIRAKGWLDRLFGALVALLGVRIALP